MSICSCALLDLTLMTSLANLLRLDGNGLDFEIIKRSIILISCNDTD